jgi:hypothetical protein
MCFDNHLNFLHLIPQFSFNFFLFSSSHSSNLSSHRHHRLPSRPCRCLIFHNFSFTSRKGHVPKHTSKLKFMKLSFQWAIICVKKVPNKRVVPFYSGDAICPKLISDCAALNVSAISPCTGLQNWWSLMHWKDGLKELLKIGFSSNVHIWTCAQNNSKLHVYKDGI